VRQLDAELRRFCARRIVRGMFLVAVLIIVLVVTVGTAKGHSGRTFTVDPTTGRQIDGSISGSSEAPGFDGQGQFVVEQSDTRTNIGKDLRDVLQGTGVALLFAGFAIGASFVGAEFNVGSLTTQLLFEPRRGRVHAAKAVAVAAGSFVFALAIMALVAFAMYLGSAVHGVLVGVDSTFAVDRLGEALRISAAVGAGSAMAYCATLVTKRSSAGMIAFYLQYPMLYILNPAKMPFGVLSHYAPLRGLIAIVVDPAGVNGINERTIHTMAGGAVLTIVWLVVLVAGAGFWFSRAEVR
jgi:hypothetical protein